MIPVEFRKSGTPHSPEGLQFGHPGTRLFLLVLLPIIISLNPLNTWISVTVILALAGVTITLNSPPLRWFGFFALVMIFFNLPVFLFLVVDPSLGIQIPARIFFRSLCISLTTIAIISKFDLAELYDSISRLPIPITIRLILIQILHQSRLLFVEADQVRQALQLRLPHGGILRRWHLIRSFPGVWLGRILYRSRRVQMAMDLREYGGSLPVTHRYRMRIIDHFTVILGFIFLTIEIIYRTW